jgi:carbonic anhydrase/acetyltransferase-like protein (isoleucine patch superfamily)
MSPTIMAYGGVWPRIDAATFVAPTAAVIGDVEIGPGCGIWFGVTIRGDVHEVRIGAGSNVQDGSVIHVSKDRLGTYIGDGVTVGHSVVIHACTLEDSSFIGMHATILDGVVVETGAMVAAGALVTPGKRVRAGELWAGVPARHVRDIGEAERTIMEFTAPHYAELAGEYLEAQPAAAPRPAMGGGGP